MTSKPDLDKNFVLECLNRNKVGDATLFCTFFKNKYVFVQEWEKFLFWNGNYWEVDMRSKRILADSECVCEIYTNAWAQTKDEEGLPFNKLLTQRLRSLRSHRGRREMLVCVTTIDDAPAISMEDLDQQPYLQSTSQRKNFRKK